MVKSLLACAIKQLKKTSAQYCHMSPIRHHSMQPFCWHLLRILAGSFVRQFTRGQWEMWKKKSPSQEGKLWAGINRLDRKKRRLALVLGGGANATSFYHPTIPQ
jgi:hypothetical protein